MAVGPVTGLFKRQIIVDFSTILGLGTAGGLVWWYGYHKPAFKQRDEYYKKLAAEKLSE
ncbi:cytochrome c oxidase subunit VIIa [Schizosaccharomyces osmophilus]|uniref:Cytochrome c oxidase subunit 9, mitochondrial n=1 Tax=Schizosaccharomyces osmophilus TaxID=2545709 RepID=A0AAE9WE60_9SCHI|nr:cytochrome c oxidase subunit VIIa [Schizosaccharomyces osmophilus]WBW73088.1 cytochrome c oxidase subunit VIIa [Schizosaccharomyces osmophilus]